MTKASATRTSDRTSPSAEFVRLTRNPSMLSPKKVERTVKAPGSLVLEHNKWFVVQPNGELVEKQGG